MTCVAQTARTRPPAAPASCEREAFDEQLPHDPQAPRAQGQADGDLLAAARAACEQHVREVQARDEQHDARHGQQEHRGGRDFGIVLRVRARAEAAERTCLDGVRAVLGGIRFGELRRERCEPRGGGFGRHPWLQAARHHQAVVGAVVEPCLTAREKRLVLGRLVHAQGQPDLGPEDRHRAGEPARGDAHDTEIAAVQTECAADEIGRKTRLAPVLVRHNRHRVGPRPLFLGPERAPLRQRCAEGGKEVGGDEHREDAARLGALGEAHHREVHREHAVEDVAAAPDVHEVRIRERSPPALLGGAPVDADERAAVGAGDRLQQQRVHEREDGGVGADAEREHEHGGGGEARRAQQGARGVTKVLQHGVSRGRTKRAHGGEARPTSVESTARLRRRFHASAGHSRWGCAC
jgi:hypothetical protein